MHEQQASFIWYHAPATLEPALQQWLHQVQQTIGITGTLYKREGEEETTFMECYHHISKAQIEQIEALATEHATMQTLHRHCETFTASIALENL